MENKKQGALPLEARTTKESNYCAACSNTGWVPAETVDGYNRVRECECAKKRRLEYRIATILKDWQEYASASFDNLVPRSPGQQAVAEAIRNNLTGSFYITGLYKRGKTYLLVCQYRALAVAGKRCVLRTARDLVAELRRSEVPATPNGEVQASDVMQLVEKSDGGHVFIDDIEKVSNTDFRMEMLWHMLDTIKRRQLSLTVSSNLPMIGAPGKDLKSKLGSEIISRLDQICREVMI